MKRQFLRFITVGLFSTIISYAIFFIALRWLGWNYLISSALGSVIGIFAGFFFNKSWTFSSSHVESRTIIFSYFAVYAASTIIGLIFLKITVDGFGIMPEIANILAIGVTTCTNFIGTKFFVFKK